MPDLGEIRDRFTGEAAFGQNPGGFKWLRVRYNSGRRLEKGREFRDVDDALKGPGEE